jgi:hypothetical protein
MTITAESVFDRLNAPFPYEEYAVNFEGYVSVSPQATSDRLNHVFGPEGWKLDAEDLHVDNGLYTVSIMGKLSIRDQQGEWIPKTQFGDATMVIKKDEQTPRPQAILDAKKKAMSDAMKKCASLLGVASDVYRGRVTVVKNGSKDYFQLVRKFNLSTNKKAFKDGIVILPHEYKSYYAANNWFGIFESDLHEKGHDVGTDATDPQQKEKIAIANLKAKYAEGVGTNEGFVEWHEKLKSKGMTYPHMEYILQEAISKRADKACETTELLQNGKQSSKAERNYSKGTANGNGDNRRGNATRSSASVGNSNTATNDALQAELKGLEVVTSDSQPYFKLDFMLKGIPTAVLAVGELMDEVEKLDLKEGVKCLIWTRMAKGKNLLRKIRLAS